MSWDEFGKNLATPFFEIIVLRRRAMNIATVQTSGRSARDGKPPQIAAAWAGCRRRFRMVRFSTKAVTTSGEQPPADA